MASITPDETTPTPSKKGGMSTTEKRNLFWGLLFVSPWLVGLIVYDIYPFAMSFYYSLTRYDLIRPPKYIGFENYVQLFTEDPNFPTVLWNTVYYVFIGVPIAIAFAFLIANLLNTKIVGQSFFRGVVYLPAIVPAVASAMVFQFLLNVQFGAINGMLRFFELPIIPFLSSPQWSKPSLILVMLWTQGAAIVIFLAALQDVPRSLYEAASLDGAGTWAQFRHVTIPMTSPIILFNLITGFIYAFQEFTIPWLLTQGGPMNSSEFLLTFLYRNAFINFRMGKASAIAYVIFFIIMIFTAIMFSTSARWVYYGGDD
ncbi:MAG: sugar ABC transporter permease [Chloroflexota bacterium]